LFAALALLLPYSLRSGDLQAGAPQQPPPAKQQEPPTIRVGVSLVNIFATVRDRSKRIVPDLAKDDFRVFEDDREQKIDFFSRETNLPLNMGILIDTSPSQEDVLRVEQEVGAQFVRTVMQKQDLAFVFSFDQEVDMLSDFTGSAEQVERALNRARAFAPRTPPGVQGPLPVPARGTRFYDAIWLACKQRLASEVGRKAVVVLTDANDQGSKVSLNEAVEAAQKSDTVVHIILISDYEWYARRGYGVGYGESEAKKIAQETGGLSIAVRNEKDLKKAFEQISEELRTQYTLGYYPTNPARDGKFRKLKVEVKHDGMRVLARRGYYAPSK
jgi:VWFA-related protein